METKIKYQYTYFIKPFKIEEKQYNTYVLKLLKDSKLKLKIFNLEKDVEIDTYFKEDIKKIMFETLSYNKEQLKELENIEENTYSKVSNIPCICFEYQLEQNTQAKMGEENGIFFRIEKINIVCFKPGICFILIKTFLEENATFNDVLNFNYKLKKINEPAENHNNYEKINLQASNLADKSELLEILQELTGNNLDREAFYTFSYLCIDGEEWNENKSFDNINMNFTKLVNVIPANENIKNEIDTINKSEYIKIGIDQNSTALITNSLDAYNYTKLPFEYENQYLYTLIYVWYQKMILNGFESELKGKYNYKTFKEKLTNFINNIWAKEITTDVSGMKLYKVWREKLKLENTYLEIVNKCEMTYKEERTRKSRRTSKIMWTILAMCLIVNTINILVLINIAK